jgi:tetratricopeptide (TPR) repeat protein
MIRNKSVLLIICILLFAVFSVRAQMPGSSRGLASGDGAYTIQGRVHFPSGTNTIPVKVILESIGTFGSMSTATDQDGVFRFRGLPAGSYTVVVEAGNHYEKAREPVRIEPGSRIVQVPIQLQFKIDASNPAFANVPGAALDFYQQGVAAAKKGNKKEAAELLEKAVLAHPNFVIAISELGQQYLLLGDLDKARATFESLLKLTANDATAHLNLGIALFNLKKLNEAETHLREALKLNSPGPTAHYYLGITLVGLKRYEDAEKELEASITNGGENLAAAHRYLGGIYMSFKKNRQAADELEKYLKLDPKAPDAERIKGTINDLRSRP